MEQQESVLALLLTVGILEPSEAVVGASNKGMLTVAILFIVAAAIQEILRYRSFS